MTQRQKGRPGVDASLIMFRNKADHGLKGVLDLLAFATWHLYEILETVLWFSANALLLQTARCLQNPGSSPAPQSDVYHFLGTSYNQLNLPVQSLSAMASYGHDRIGTASINLTCLC